MIRIACVVDDAAPDHSPFRAEHGVAFLIETRDGAILFDTGQSSAVLLHNMGLLGVEPEEINALAISHAHYDHTGGLPGLLAHVAGIPLYAHPDLFRERFSRKEGPIESVGLSLDREALEQHLELRLGAEPAEILPGVWTTGEIADHPEPEGRSDHHLVRGSGRQAWEPDSYRDDMSLALRTDEGWVVLCGCCHAGLLNTLAHVRRTFGPDIAAVVGGAHLLHADEARVQRVVEVLRELGVPRLYLNHCTGQRTCAILAQAFGDKVAACPAGTQLRLS